MNLYQIKEEFARVIAAADPDTGEVDFDAIERLNLSKEECMEQMALTAKNLISEANAIKSEMDMLSARREAKVHTSELIRDKLCMQMAEDGQKKFETPKCLVKLNVGKRLAETDPDALMAYCKEADFLRYKNPEIDKKAVTACIKNGLNVPGAVLEETKSITIK